MGINQPKNKSDEGGTPESNTEQQRPFSKSASNAILGGVCSGLARHFDLPVWAVRLIFLVLSATYGLGLLAYAILYVAMPRDPDYRPLEPLYRRVDWISFGATGLITLIGYYFSLSPDLTLEDSGELAVGSMYAGVPHPPGYPVWTIYTWLFTEFIPFFNIAWRVALSSAVAASLSCALIALMVSRGSSKLISGIESLSGIDAKRQGWLCAVAGFVAGNLMAFNGFFWSQAVIVEVYTLSVLSLTGVLACLQRWVWTPEARKYLYWALFLFGICFTNHQTLIVAAVGIELLILCRDKKLGRDLFLGNTIVYLLLLGFHIGTDSRTLANPMIFKMFNLIGFGSMVLAAINYLPEKGRERLYICGGYLLGAMLFWIVWSKVTDMEARRAAEGGIAAGVASKKLIGFYLFLNVVCLGALIAYIVSQSSLKRMLKGWIPVVMMGVMWLAGISLYLYMPVASMSNPPMNWGYPRTVEGFRHAVTRGQYENPNPTSDAVRFFGQLEKYVESAVDEFNLVYLLIGLVPLGFVFYRKLSRQESLALAICSGAYIVIGLAKFLQGVGRIAESNEAATFFGSFGDQWAAMVGLSLGYIVLAIAVVPFIFRRHFKDPERAWLGGLCAIFVCLAIILLILLNPQPDRQALQLNRVFFTASQVMISMFIGYGVALIGALSLKCYQRFRPVALAGAAACVLVAFGAMFLNDIQLPISWATSIFGFFLALSAFAIYAAYRHQVHFKAMICLFAIMPVYSAMNHWWDNEQRGHIFGYWFGHDMFAPPFADDTGEPLYPEMAKDAILFGGTDPGRFNPTYMIFAESFLEPGKRRDPEFDRRDVYIITQNALADTTYLAYIRAHYNRSTQIDPPFFVPLMEQIPGVGKFKMLARPLDTFFLSLGDKIEKRRRTFTSWFDKDDFTDAPKVVEALKNRSNALATYLHGELSDPTREALAAGQPAEKLAADLAKDFNRILDAGPLYSGTRFEGIELSEYVREFVAQGPQSHTLVRLNRLLLEEAFPGAIARSKGGVYPDREIHTPSVEESQIAFETYVRDAQKRMQNNQLKPGENVSVVGNKLSVSGQTAVMSINALLTKVIFDKNPNHEFYVEESFPLDWMFPHLTPYGIIMRINREPIPEMTQEIIDRDHAFWSRYSERLIGDWIDYDTPVSEVVDFARRVYIQYDFRGFEGDLDFVRDDNAKKAFSKLRTAIGHLYFWRINEAARKGNSEEYQRMIKEADFAFKQAFAFCPYSPEAVFKYVNLLTSMQRNADALAITSVCLEMDPDNQTIRDLYAQLSALVNQPRQTQPPQPQAPAPTQQQLTSIQATATSPNQAAPQTANVTAQLRTQAAQLKQEFDANPSNATAGLTLAQVYFQLKQTNEGIAVMDRILNSAALDSDTVTAVAHAFAQLGAVMRLERALRKLTEVNPESPEAWYDLAAIQARIGAAFGSQNRNAEANAKNSQALSTLSKAIALSNRRLEDTPTAKDLRTHAATADASFSHLHTNPTFQALVGSGKQ